MLAEFIKRNKIIKEKIKVKAKSMYSYKSNYFNKVLSKIKLSKITNLKVKLIISKLIVGSQNKRKIANSLIKAVNGNIGSNNLKNFTWNKSDSNISDKMGAIRNIIKKEKPAILFVQELNLDIYQLKI